MNFLYLMVEINILMPAVDENIFEGYYRDIRGSRFRSFPDRSDEESPSWNGEYGYIPYV